MIILIYLYQLIFFLLFFSLKLYYHVTHNYILSGVGGKLEKYIQKLQSITCSLNNTKCNKRFILLDFFNISPSWYKQVLKVLFVSADMLILNICVSYSFLVSNSLFITIFGKNIEFSLILGKYYVSFKFAYYILFFLFVFNLTYKINKKKSLSKLSKQKSAKISSKSSYDIVLQNYQNKGNYSNNEVVITEQGLYQNILITGSVGSGKTSGAISNILDQLIKKGIGGLVIDIKGNFVNEVVRIAKRYNRRDDVIEISLKNNFMYNPLDNGNLTNLELANVIKKVLVLISKDNKNSEPFWLDKAEEFIRNAITLIRAYNKGNVNFNEIQSLVINKDYLDKKILYLKQLILENMFSDDELFEIDSAIVSIKNDFLSLDSRTLGIIKSEITRMTSIFLSSKKLNDKFCKETNKIDFNSNKIYVLSLNLSNSEKISKIISTYLKLQFQKEIINFGLRNNPVFFLCDEYQEICNSEDANFFSISREFKCINIVSSQSYSSLLNTLGNEYVTNVILQNFVNKIWFRNDDEYTVKRIISQIGKEKSISISKSYNENGKNARYSRFVNDFISYKSDFSKSYTENENIQNKYNEEFFTQELKTFEAMCLISDGSKMKLYDKVKFKRWEDDK